MASVHGKGTVLTIATQDISQYCTTSKLTRGADEHDITGYGKDDHVVRGGLRKGSFSVEGWYDNTASTGPRAVLAGQEGNTLAITREPEGTGSGKPHEEFDGLLTEYVETNPVADIVTWSASFTVSDAITDTTQS